MRQIVTAMIVVFLSGYAFKDWYKTLCGAIVMMAVLEHPDMPRGIMGIPGFNYFNLLLIIILLSFVIQKNSEKLIFNPIPLDKFLILLYCCVMLLSFIRLITDLDSLAYYEQLTGHNFYATNMADIFNMYLLSFKWMLPGLLLFWGCNSKERFVWAEISLGIMLLLIAFQVVKHIPPSSVHNVGKLTTGALKFDRWVGYHRGDLSLMLAGGSWFFIILLVYFKKVWQRLVLLGCSGFCFLGLLVTGGRSGYLGCAVGGIVFGLMKWKKILLLLPIVLILIVQLFPPVRDRAMIGVSSDPWQEKSEDVSAGRYGAWHLVIEQIKKEPVWGFGRLAVHREGLSYRGMIEDNEFFGHPHNAYLEFLLDNGIVGLGIVLLMYLVLMKKGLFLFRSSDPVSVVAGGTFLSFSIMTLVASLTSYTFYPKESTVLFWCSVGLMLRIYVERNKQIQGHTGFNTTSI